MKIGFPRSDTFFVLSSLFYLIFVWLSIAEPSLDYIIIILWVMKMMIKRGDIFYADLNPVIGSEQGGVRPVLIVQNDVRNRHSPTVIAVPISSAEKSKLSVHIRIRGSGLPKDSTILAEQIRTLDRCRIGRYVGSLDSEMMRNIDEIIKISLGVNANE